MPYATTKEELEKHFENVEGIKSTRLLTDKATGKPKGFAFMEFEHSKDLNVSFIYIYIYGHRERENVNVFFFSL